MRNLLPGHDTVTARFAGLTGLKNGALLIAAEAAQFDVLLTADQGFEFEQSMRGRRIAILIFRAKSNRLSDLVPLIPTCLAQLRSLQPGEIIRIPG